MKNIIARILGVLVLTVGILSCSSDDNSSGNKKNMLLGTWMLKQELYLDAKGVVLETLDNENESCPLETEVFGKDGALTSVNHYFDYELQECVRQAIEGAWRVEGTKLYLEYPGLVQAELRPVFTISEMTETKLILEYPMSRFDMEDYPEHTVTIRVVFNAVK